MKKLTQEEFSKRVKELHEGKINVDKSEYINQTSKIIATCYKHGDFLVSPDSLLHGHGCPNCKREKLAKLHSITQDEFLKRAKKVHGDKYDYSKVKYINSTTKICIICPKHGEFCQIPNSHLSGKGCPACSKNVNYDTYEFIKRAQVIHGEKYNYDKCEYINAHTKVIITCEKHGDFMQTPTSHLSGKGCPKCASSLLENKISLILESNGYSPNEKYKIKWLNGQSADFYLADKNIVIECQGAQHFKPIPFFGGEQGFTSNIERDFKKSKLCKENGAKLIYVIKKEDRKASLQECFQHIYDDALFIEDIDENPQILIDRINEISESH